MRVSLFCFLLALAVPVCAQPKDAGGFTFSASKQVADQNGLHLYGSTAKPARIDSPQLTVVAPTIVFDLVNQKPVRVRALGGVALKVNLASPPTPGTPKPSVTHVESTSQEATLTVATRTLVLTKNLKGFYQVDGGAKNTLSGDSATLVNQNAEFTADIQGGQEGVTISVPAETLGRPDDLGTVTLTARNAKINQKTGLATFSGNARAVATGPNAFDVTANEFVLTRNANDNTIATLTTRGRTLVKLDLPPDAAPATNVTTPDKTPDKNPIGKPTHVEVASDGAIIERATSKATFSGNVKGFYRLAPVAATAGAPAPPQNYDFSGDRAVLRYDPTKGNAQNALNVEITGTDDKAAIITLPPFDLDL